MKFLQRQRPNIHKCNQSHHHKWMQTDNVHVDKQTLQTLFQCRSKLSLAHNGNIILKEHRIVLPPVLQAQPIKLARTGRQGIGNTTAIFWEKVWFRGMRTLVERTMMIIIIIIIIINCFSCQISTPNSTKEPLKISLSLAPWTQVSADFEYPTKWEIHTCHRWVFLLCDYRHYQLHHEKYNTTNWQDIRRISFSYLMPKPSLWKNCSITV